MLYWYSTCIVLPERLKRVACMSTFIASRAERLDVSYYHLGHTQLIQIASVPISGSTSPARLFNKSPT